MSVSLPLLRPMLALSSEPFDSERHMFEIKWDGYRCLAYLEGRTVLSSRNCIDFTGKFPELTGLHQVVKGMPSVLDGEIVVFEKGKPSFAGLQSRGRMDDRKRISRAAAESPAFFIAFDMLYFNGESVMGLPLRKRRSLLEGNVKPGEGLIISEFILKDGMDFFGACAKEGLEGVVAKELESVYLPGRRSVYWKKFRHTREADLVVCGYQYGPGGGLGSLVLGGYREGRMVYQGKVGTGFGVREASALLEGLRKLEVTFETLSAPREEMCRTMWVRPALVCSVEYLATTANGLLRHPVYRGLRWDKTPEECLAAV